MPNDSFEDFIDDQLEPDKPTAEQLVWAIENFSSRVNPPTVPATPTTIVISDTTTNDEPT